VVIPAYRAAETIETTLAHLAQQTFTDVEIVIVDCGSDDGTVELVHDAITANKPANMRLVSCGTHDPNTCACAGQQAPGCRRNLGVSSTTAPLIAFTDADCAPEPGWLAAGIKALNHADLVQGAVTPERPPVPFDRTVSVGGEHGLYETANLFVTRSAWEKVNGFEPVPGIKLAPGASPFGEDVWFAWRVKRAGALTAFAPNAVVKHAVFPRGALGYIAEQTRRRHFPALVNAVPELRDAFLYRRLFLSKRVLQFDLAAAGIATSLLTKRKLPLLAALPYALKIDRRPKVAATALAADTVGAASQLAGSLRAKTPVL
jgi:glycosyltransferase involved in cell wall biosynthesis